MSVAETVRYRIELEHGPGGDAVTVKHRNPYSGRWDLSFTTDSLMHAAEVLGSSLEPHDMTEAGLAKEWER